MWKQYLSTFFDISGSSSFVILLIFIFSTNVSIAGCYIALFFLLPPFINHILIKRKRIPHLPRFFWCLLVYAGASLVSTLFASDPMTSLKDNRDLLIFMLVPMLTLILNSPRRIKWALGTLLASSLFASIIGLFITTNRILNDQDPLSLDHRLKGFMSHWMTYSGLLMMVFVFFLVYQFYEKNPLKRKIVLAGLFIMAVAILITQTRSIWVGIIISMLFYLLSFNWKRALLVIPIALFVYSIAPGQIRDRIHSIVDLDEPSNRDRIHMAYTAWGIFKDFPLTGVGANNVAIAYPQYRHPDAIQDNMHLHNNFLHILAERGLIGFLSLCLLFFIIARDLYTLSQGDHRQFCKAISKASFFAFLSFLFAGFFEYNFGDTEIRFALLTLVTIPFLLVNLQSDSPQTIETTP